MSLQELVIVTGMSGAGKGTALKAFEDLGYFCVDKESTADKLIFNRTVSLKDEWSKLQKKQGT